MKYTELKSKLKEKVQNAYLIFGDDRYLCFDALKKIEDSAGITIKDMNSVVVSGESSSIREIVDSANIYPFGDNYRLIVVKNLEQSKSKQDKEILKKYLSSPLSSTILVFFSPEGADYFKGMNGIEFVDCNKIDAKFISAFIKNQLIKNDISSSDEAIDTLITFCANDMTRITNELEKLMAYSLDSKKLLTEDIKNFVIEDREYQIYELAEFIAKGESWKAMDLIDSFAVKSGSGFLILSPLFNNYRRALYISINKDKTSAELANLLGVKEFAIKMMKKQVEVFSPKKLKQIVDMIAEYDKKIKVGEMKENIAIKTIVLNILNIRGN